MRVNVKHDVATATTSPVTVIRDGAGGHREQHDTASHARLNALRAAVLGANDGIVSVAGIVVGVAGANAGRAAVFTAGLAGLVAGTVSMALGEYVSVSGQRDSERSLIAKERDELETTPDAELAELAAIYESKGLSAATAQQVAVELTAHDGLAAHLDAELNLNPDDLVSPVRAAAASAASFVLGAVLPLVAILVPPNAVRVPVTVVAVLLALAVTGLVSARTGGARVGPAVVRLVVGGGLGILVTYGIGHLLGSVIT